MEELTAGHVESLHSGIIRRDGGDARVISEANLHQLVFHANLIHSCVNRAAFVFWFLCAYPAFREGNLRTAYAIADEVLASGGYQIAASREDIRTFAKTIAQCTTDTGDAEAWFRDHIRNLSEREG